MRDSLHSLLTWLLSEHGVATLEYVGGIFLGPEVLTILLGKRLTEQLSGLLSRVRTALNPVNTRIAAKRITIGPVTWIALALCTSALIWIVVREIHDPRIARLLSANDIAFFPWLIKLAWLTLFNPLVCIGVAVGVYVTGSSKARESFNAWVERLGAGTFEAQQRRDLVQQLTVALVGSVALIGFSIGLFAGNLILVIVFHVVEKPLRALGFILDQDRLRRAVAVIGFFMITASFAIKLSR
jgi:hypothetical protein